MLISIGTMMDNRVHHNSYVYAYWENAWVPSEAIGEPTGCLLFAAFLDNITYLKLSDTWADVAKVVFRDTYYAN